MTEPPPRKRFQIHLSTAIVMMFVAGALIWANVHANKFVKPYSYRGSSVTGATHGWPFPIIGYLDDGNGFMGKEWMQEGSAGDGFGRKEDEGGFIQRNALFIDGIITFANLFAVWLFCEWLIRRRAARKGA